MKNEHIKKLPSGWRAAPIGSIFKSWGGHTPPKSNAAYWGEGIPWLSSKEIKSARVRVSTHSVTPRAVRETGLKICPPGSVLVVMRSGILAHTLPVAITEVPVTINQDLKAFYSDEPYMNEWLALFLQMSEQALLANSRRDGTTVQSIQYPLLKNTLLPYPPAGERQQIIEFADQIIAKQISVLPHLTKARSAAERFRRSVLATACSGRLTADWRETNSTTPAASQLIVEIAEARKEVHKSVEPKTVAKPDDEETPDSWSWVSFGSVIGELRNGVSIAPAMEPPGVPILRISAARPRRVDLSDLRYLRDDAQNWTPFMLHDGDLLFTRYNGSLSLLGVCGMVRGLGDQTMLHPDKLMRVRFDHQYIEPEYVEIFFSSPLARARMTAGSVSSAGQQGISGATVKAQPLVLPPLDEQREIVRRVGQLLQLADGLTSRIDIALKRVDRTSQAVLAKAFRGELTTLDEEEAAR